MVPSTPPISLVTHFGAPCDVERLSTEELIKFWEGEEGEVPPSVAAGIRAIKE